MGKNNRYTPFDKGTNAADIYDPAMKIESAEDAKDYLERIVEYFILHGHHYEKAEYIAKSNLGYWTGYYDQETANRVFKLFDCEHPVFGREFPTPEEAFKKGMEWAEKNKKRK